MIEAIVKDRLMGVGTERIAGRFHLSLAIMIAEVCAQLHRQTGLKQVVLSGGVFQNCLLTEMVVPRLETSGLTVLTHCLVPPNDGGVALGQAAVAAY
jgi:hydrogenase maturation protein HypF